MSKRVVPRPKRFKKRTYKKKPSSFLSKAVKYGSKAVSIAGKVATIARMINAEKQRIDNRCCSDAVVAQCIGNVDSGAYAIDITPVLPQGNTVATRKGSSVKLSSLQIRAQVRAQSALQTKAKVKFYIVHVKGTPVLSSSYVQTLWRFLDIDSITGLHDYHSLRNPDWFSMFRVLGTFTAYIAPDSLSGQTQYADIRKNIRLNHHVRYDADSNNLASGQIMMFAVSSTGNGATSGASTLTNIVNTAPLTGQLISMDTRYYYYDN